MCHELMSRPLRIIYFGICMLLLSLVGVRFFFFSLSCCCIFLLLFFSFSSHLFNFFSGTVTLRRTMNKIDSVALFCENANMCVYIHRKHFRTRCWMRLDGHVQMYNVQCWCNMLNISNRINIQFVYLFMWKAKREEEEEKNPSVPLYRISFGPNHKMHWIDGKSWWMNKMEKKRKKGQHFQRIILHLVDMALCVAVRIFFFVTFFFLHPNIRTMESFRKL